MDRGDDMTMRRDDVRVGGAEEEWKNQGNEVGTRARNVSV